jgi:dTDP-4-dehydrorhamnose reductase
VALDLERPETLALVLDRVRPEAIVHAAAVSRPPWAEAHPEEAMAVNRDASGCLARLAAKRQVRLVAVSTDLVFPGRPGGGYREDDEPSPLGVYGRSKLEGERAVLAAWPRALVVRTSLLVDTGRLALSRLLPGLESGAVPLYADEWRSPIAVGDLALALLELAQGHAAGVLHLGGPERLSRFELGRLLVDALGLDPGLLRRASQRDAPPPPRPSDVSLDSSRALGLLRATRVRPLRDALGG